MKIVFLTFIALFLFQGCVEYKDDPLCVEYEYFTFEELRKGVTIEAPREIENAGKIYVYENILLINEINQGIHIIDNQDKENPVTKAFIKIPGNIDLAIKDGYLYVDSYMDLVVIDVRDINSVKELTRRENVFEYDMYDSEAYYEYYDVIYECGYDLSLGVIIKANK